MQNTIQNETSLFAPVCQVCQSQNESLRVITYPFVVSVIFATFQRVFSGIYCAKHQRIYHLLASLITSTAGWLGIPFGFFLTPLALVRLARGGIVNDGESLQTLSLIADKKLRTGDTKGAIRCLEECLKFKDNHDIRERLTRLYGQHRSTTDVNAAESLWQFLSVPLLLTVALLTGLLTGLLDILLIYVLSPLFGASGSIFVAILSWLPTVTMLFLEVLLLRGMLGWALRKGQVTSLLLGILLTVVTTCFAFYSILEGHALLRNLQGLFTFFSISTQDGIFALRSVLTHGGIDVLINNFKQGELPTLIFGILFVSAAILSLYTGLETSVQIVNWQNRLTQLRDPAAGTSRSSVLASIMLGLLIMGVLLFNALVFPGTFVNTEQTHAEISLGLSELDQNHYEEAVHHFEQAAALWPSSVTAHTYLALGYAWKDRYDNALQELETALRLDPDSTFSRLMHAYAVSGQGKYDQAIDEFLLVSKSQPEWGLPHADLANVYLLANQEALAEKEIQLALLYEANDGQTSSSIANYYAQLLEFEKAEEHLLKAIKIGNDPEDYISLARIYVSQQKFDEAVKVIEEASKQGADPVEVYLAKINAAESQEDLETANALLAKAIKQYPDKSDLLSESSYLLFLKGEFERSRTEAEKAVQLDPYNSSAYIELAFAHYAQGKLDEAVKAAEQGMSLYPRYDRAHYILGLCYMDLGMKEEAIQEFETFLKLYWERPAVREYKENALHYLDQLK